MNCEDFHAKLHARFIGEMSEEEFAPFGTHPDECSDCAKLVRLAFELSCREFVEFLDDYVAGSLEPSRREVFERHLSICPDCTNYLDSYRKTMELERMALTDGATPPGPVPEELLRAILDSIEKE